MADKKFSAFTSQAMTASSELVGFDGNANTRYDITELQAGLNIVTKRRFITTAVFRNLFGAGSPITGTNDIAQFGYVSTEDNPSLFIATSAVKLIKIGFKWLGNSPTTGIDPVDSWEIFAYPLTSANLNADAAASYGSGTTTGLILTNADNGTFPGKTNTLASPISMSAGQMWAFAGVETGTIGTATAEAIIWLEFEEA
tara:strand:- start:162 stop:758 length:597 start_codon:yes stop_codon:yes gene_type:complete